MGVKLDLVKQDGKIIHLDIGEGYLEKDEFDEILSVVKDLEDREYDSTVKKWNAPLTEDNIQILELILSEDKIKELKDELKDE